MRNSEWSLDDKARIEIKSIVSNSKLYKSESFNKLAISTYTDSFIKKINNEYEKFKYDKSDDRYETGLGNLISDFRDDPNTIEKIKISIDRFFRNRMVLENDTMNPVFKTIALRLESKNEGVRGFYNGGIMRVREIAEDHIDLEKISYVLRADNLDSFLNKLFLKLKEGGFINTKTKDIDFLKAFTGKPLEEIYEKIKWEKTKKSCVYFICQLLKLKIPYTQIEHPFESEEKNYSKKLEYLFQDRKGNPIKEAYKLKDKLKEGVSEEVSELDKILKSLK